MKNNLLIFEQPSETLLTNTEEINRLGFNVLKVSQVDWLLDFLIDSNQFTLIALDAEALGKRSGEILEVLQSRFPDLPIVWINRAADSSLETSPNAVVWSPDDGDFQAFLLEQIKESFFPDRLINWLERALVKSFEETSGIQLHKKTETIATEDDILAPISAMIHFQGAEISGSLVLTGTRSLFETVAANFYGTTKTNDSVNSISSTPSEVDELRQKLADRDCDLMDEYGLQTIDMAKDAAGEICNVVLGRLRRTCLKEAQLAFRQGCPVVTNNFETCLRGPKRLTLILQLGNNVDALFAELCIEDVRLGSEDSSVSESSFEISAPEDDLLFL